MGVGAAGGAAWLAVMRVLMAQASGIFVAYLRDVIMRRADGMPCTIAAASAINGENFDAVVWHVSADRVAIIWQ